MRVLFNFNFDTIKKGVGEYERDYGFFLPKPVSMNPELSRSRLRKERFMQTLQKMKILGAKS